MAVDAAIGMGVSSMVFVREKLAFDSRVVVGSAPLLRGGLVLFQVLEGRVHWGDGACFDAPFAYALPSEHLEVVTNNATHYRLVGDRVRVVEHWLVAHEPIRKGPITLRGPALDAAEHLSSLCEAGADRTTRADAANAVLEAFADAGWCERRSLSLSNAPEWERLGAALGELDLGRSLKLLAELATVSERQFYRDFGFVDITGAGFREAVRRFRLRLGVLLLSSPDGTVGEVARALGYGRPEAMTAMFRSAGLPTPSELRAELTRAE